MNKIIMHSVLRRGFSHALPGPLFCPLLSKQAVSPDTYIFRFGLPSATSTLGIGVGEHIQIACELGGEQGLVCRKYTPTNQAKKTI